MEKTLHRLAAVLALALPAACTREDIGAARYGLDDCRRVALIDSASGGIVRGAEDLALDADSGRLFISAYDRRAAEKAARKRGAAPPSGGVYAVVIDDLFDPQTAELRIRALAASGDFAGGLRPHGISYDAANKELVFVNRSYARDGGKWKMTPHLRRIGANGEAFVGAPAPAPCAANDVEASGGAVITSFDHGGCGAGATLENVFSLKRSGVSSQDGGVLFDRAVFANGLARTAGGDIVMAATREKSLLVLDETDKGFGVAKRIALPGGPDNLTIAADGGVVAAVHPSLLKLTGTRKFGIGKAPSRIVKADPDTGAVEILFDDPKAKVFSAATAAVETGAGLVAGSVTDEGLMVCRAAS